MIRESFWHIPDDLQQQLKRIAEEQNRTLDSCIINILREYVKRGEWLDDRETDDGK